MAKRKPKKNGCNEGWIPLEIKLGKQKLNVCVQLPKGAGKRGKGKGKGRDALDWTFGTVGGLEVVAALIQGLTHH